MRRPISSSTRTPADSATAKMVPAKITFTVKTIQPTLGYGRARYSYLLFLPDLHSLNLFKGKLVP
jgi:hypothetical protein